MTIYTIISVILFIILFVFLNHRIDKYYDKKFWDKPLRNFPFRFKGKILWYSRSVATTLLVLAKDIDGKLYVLANKRGKGCPDYNGYWNLVCGYLDFNLSGEENAVKECHEETGIEINPKDLEMIGVNTSPKENKQNVSIRYRTILPNTIDKYKFDLSYMEKDEVDDIKFIPIEEIDNYEWAFNHKDLIKNNIPN